MTPTLPTPAVTVVAVRPWFRPMGICGDGHAGQATHVRVGGIDAWVRENLRVQGGTFLMHSGERMGFSRSGSAKSIQVLELATAGDWEAVASAVRSADASRRPVVRSTRWTVRTARSLFSEGGGYA